jgi:hypothetical protein
MLYATRAQKQVNARFRNKTAQELLVLFVPSVAKIFAAIFFRPSF